LCCDLPPENESSPGIGLKNRKGVGMARKSLTPEQIINRLREAEVALSGKVRIEQSED
jgi:hypothetical protein